MVVSTRRSPRGERRSRTPGDRRVHRTAALIAAVAFAAAVLTGCGSDGDNSPAPTAAAATATPTATPTSQEAVPAVVKVSIGDNFYKPKNLTIVRGQSISWRNQGAVAHTVTSNSDSSVKFDSSTLEPGAAYALKPTTVGKLSYSCSIHGTVQSGTITVTR
jgi:plastocyanin